MTALKEKAVRMINNLPEEQVEYVIRYIKEISYHSELQTKNIKKEAFDKLEKIRLHLTDDFDENKALEEALNEKYGNFT